MQQPDARPSAVIVYTHFMAMRLIRLLWEIGIKVPEELSVVTFSNASPVEDFIPPLTTMALPTEEMGRSAAEMVLEQINTQGKAAAEAGGDEGESGRPSLDGGVEGVKKKPLVGGYR